MLGTVWAFPGVSHVISPAVGQITDSEGKEESWMREGQSSSGQLSGHSPLPGRKGGTGKGVGETGLQEGGVRRRLGTWAPCVPSEPLCTGTIMTSSSPPPLGVASEEEAAHERLCKPVPRV